MRADEDIGPYQLLSPQLCDITILFGREVGKAEMLRKLDAAARAAKEAGKKSLLGFGWNYYIIMPDKPTLKELDAVTHGVSIVIFDSSGHNALCNFGMPASLRHHRRQGEGSHRQDRRWCS